MSVGCIHNPKLACPECVQALSEGNAAYLQTNLTPKEGESLAQFQGRMQLEQLMEGISPEQHPVYVEPSCEEQKRIIKDSSIPEPVRRYWRERLYGKGSGRKGVQQDRAQRVQTSLKENFASRTMEALASQYGQGHTDLRPAGMSGRQWKRFRKVIRQGAKIVKGI